MCDDLQNQWLNLTEKITEKTRKLELCLKVQQYISDSNEVESWLNEKRDILTNTDYIRDRAAASKLLTKHKVALFT